MTRLRYVNRDHTHPLYGRVGTKLAQGVGPGPRNCLVHFDDGTEVIAPYNNFRKADDEVVDTTVLRE